MSGRGKQKQPGRTVQMGRKVASLPVPTWEQRRQQKANRLRELEEQNRKLREENEAAKRKAADDVHAKECENTCFLNIQAHKLDSIQGRKLIHRVEAERRRYVRDRPDRPQDFPVFDVVKQIVSELRGTLAPVPRDANPLHAQLPPPAGEARPPMHRSQEDDQRRDEQRRVQYEVGRKLSEDEAEQKRRYEAALRKYGMTSATINHTMGEGGFGGLGR